MRLLKSAVEARLDWKCYAMAMDRFGTVALLLASLSCSNFVLAQQPEDAQVPAATQQADNTDVVAEIQQLKADINRLNQEVNLLKTEIKQLQNSGPQTSISQPSVAQSSRPEVVNAAPVRTPSARIPKATPARPASQSPTAAPAPVNNETAPVTTLLFRDGRRVETRNYAIVGESIWVYSEDASRKYPLSDLDIDGTKKINADHGIAFELPPGS